MFTTIIDTPSRHRLAAFFLNNSPRAFHAEEVRKATGEPGPMVAVNLKHFVKNGFLRTSERKGEAYYRLNPRYGYLEELRGFVVSKNHARVRDNVWQSLEKLNNTVLVILTGIFTNSAHMPTDLVIVGTPSPSTMKKVIELIEKEMRLDVNYTIFSQEEFDERVNMYERFTRDLFDNPHLIVFDKRVKPNKKIESSSLKNKK